MIQPPQELAEIDRRIWTEELASFVPQRIFDVHTHLYRAEFNTGADQDPSTFDELTGRDFPTAGWAELNAWDAVLLPARQVHRLSFGFPFRPAGDFEASNRFVAEQIQNDAESAALMLVHPSMSREYVEEWVSAHGFLGFKPYMFYSVTGDVVNCRITDFLPEEQIEIANRRKLIITLHLAKRGAIGDRENLDDLLRLTTKYGDVKWILAHCARSYAPWVLERAIEELRGLPNVWYDVSSVCDPDVIEMLMAGVGPDRVMYGSDDIPVGVSRGKYITFGFAWAFLSETNHSLGLSHCDPRMTYVRYEQLRAMRRAALRLSLSPAQIDDFFYNTAAGLVRQVRG
jgi:hypothetical protein